ELINDHLEQHQLKGNISPELQPFCSLCYPPSQEFTLPFRRFWLWIETAEAKSYNRITQQTFQELINYDYGEFACSTPFYLVNTLLSTIRSGSSTPHTEDSNDNEEEEEIIEDEDLINFSSPESSSTDEEVIYEENLEDADEEQVSDPDQIRTPTPEPEMANVADVLNALEMPSKPQYPPRNNDYRGNWSNNRRTLTCYSCGEEGHISTQCPTARSNNNYRNNNGKNWRDRNNGNSHLQNNAQPNMENRSTNNGRVNNDTNAALLMQIQELTNALQTQTVKDNINNVHSLLATHKYLPGERKSRKVDRHNPYAKQSTSQDEDLEKEQNQENEPLVEDSDMGEAEPSKTQEAEEMVAHARHCHQQQQFVQAQCIAQTIPGFVEVPTIKLTEISPTNKVRRRNH
ncbi:11764_t:CDS:2, partial [Ambispora gerdemannii]